MNDLQLFAKCYVEVHDLSTEDKKKLFEFIDTAKDYEIMNLLTTGRPESLPVEQASLVEANFQNTIVYPFVALSEADPIHTVTSTLGGIWNKILTIQPSVTAAKTTYVNTPIGSVKAPDFLTKFFWNLAKKTSGKKSLSIGSFDVFFSKGAAEQIARRTDHLIKLAVNGGMVIGATVIVALFLFLAKKLLAKGFSKAARACKGLPKYKKIECIKKYKIDTLQAQIKLLEKGLTSCQHTTKPEKCQKKLRKKINKLKKDLEKTKSKL